MKKWPGLLLLFGVALSLIAGVAYAMSSRNYRLDWYDLLSGVGGPPLASPDYGGRVSVGQPAVRTSSGISYTIRMGYWNGFVKPPVAPSPRAFVPLVLRQPTPTVSPVPAIPVLDFIVPPEMSAVYTITWTAAERAEVYVLEQATGPSFADATQVYVGPALQYVSVSEGTANYHFRAKARNTYGDSAWSNVQPVEVRWEQEPNDQITELNNRSKLMFDKAHYGTMATDRELTRM